MIPVIQTITEAGKGNCLAACIASILEAPIDEILDLKSGGNLNEMRDYLERKGVVPIWVHCDALSNSYVGYTPEHCIVIGNSPRQKGVQHAVVGKPQGYGYEIVHDPHPQGGGLDGPVTSVIYFGAVLRIDREIIQ